MSHDDMKAHVIRELAHARVIHYSRDQDAGCPTRVTVEYYPGDATVTVDVTTSSDPFVKIKNVPAFPRGGRVPSADTIRKATEGMQRVRDGLAGPEPPPRPTKNERWLDDEIARASAGP